MPNFPSAFQQQMQSLLGEEYALFEKAYEDKAPASIRVNKDKIGKEITLEPIGWTASGYYLPERPSFTLDPTFHAGGYYVQEASSMFLEQAFKQHIDTAEALNVLDLCASPGGKSTHILSLISRDSLLVANEVIKTRAYTLKENIQKWGNANVVITNSDPDKFSSLTDFFDVMVIDAPCSGEGLFRRDEEAMKEWSPENVQLCVARQQRILEEILEALKPGGYLIYSTCTFNTQEDEENLDWLMKNFELQSLPITIQPNWGITEVKSGRGGVGYKFFPHKAKGEGFFMTVFCKPEGIVKQFSAKKNKSPLTQLSKDTFAALDGWLKEDSGLSKVQFGEMILALPTAKLDDIYYLSMTRLHLISCGLEIAELKKKNNIPLAAFALSKDINLDFFPQVELDYQNALKFLAKENFDTDLPEGDWMLACYKGLPLGWLKKINNRYNNYYPVEWRIRMDVSKGIMNFEF